jgi:hypothetical protein
MQSKKLESLIVRLGGYQVFAGTRVGCTRLEQKSQSANHMEERDCGLPCRPYQVCEYKWRLDANNSTGADNRVVREGIRMATIDTVERSETN